MEVSLEEDALVVKLGLLEKLAAVRWTDVRVPRDNVAGAEPVLPPPTWKQLRLPGTHLPGLIKAGTYLTNRGWEFWYLTRNGRQHPVTVSLRGHRYARLVLGIGEPTAERINEWATRRAGLG
jgi:hypothetical protein